MTDVCFCVFIQTAIAPNETFQWMGDAYLRKKENGIDVDYTNSSAARLYKCYEEFGIDLDFSREIFCFDCKNEPECHKIMTEYYTYALEFGFDIKTYVDEGLFDAVVAAPRWRRQENVKAQATEPVHGIRTGTGADSVLTTHTPLAYDVSGISTDNSVILSFTGNGTVYYVNIIVDAE